MTALIGTTSVSFFSVGRDADAGVHAGLQAEAGFGISISIGRGARGRVEHGRDARDPAHEHLAGERIDFDDRLVPRRSVEILLDHVGDERTRLMSTTSTIGAFCPTNAPGSTARRATKPFTGETMIVLAA
jgi:hypothetical protein